MILAKAITKGVSEIQGMCREIQDWARRVAKPARIWKSLAPAKELINAVRIFAEQRLADIFR